MFIMKILSVLVSLCCVVHGQQGPCTAAKGGRGECKSIYDCPPLLSVLNKSYRTQQDVDILRKSHCGFFGNAPAVCCPEQSQQLKQCSTPEGKPGQCVDLKSCPDLANLLQKPTSIQKEQYVQRSKCDGSDRVCCGPVPNFNVVKPGRCAATVSAFPPEPSSGCCGIDSRVGNKLYGANQTAIDEYPWLAIIEYIQGGVMKTLCGGSLISSKYVLTAGHCVVGEVLKLGRPKSIRLGEYDTTNDGSDCTVVEGGGEDCNDGITRIPIEKIITHPQYNPYTVERRNDIALIRMTELAPFTEFIRPICLPTTDVTVIPTPFNLTAAGWGAVSDKVRSSAVKLYLHQPFITQEQCQVAYSPKVALWKGQLCAGGRKGEDTCKGDSGGPLMYENGRTYEVTGVISFGPKQCGQENVPGVGTNVYEYKSWIISNIKE